MATTHPFLALLEQDLRALAEVREARKFPEVKEAAELALLRLRCIMKALNPNAPAEQQATRIAEAEDLLVPFMLALASKSDALPQSALGAVQRMILHSAVAPKRLSSVTAQLIARAQLPSADDSSLLKVLQTVLTIASSPALLYSDTIVSQLLVVCLTLHQSRAPTIRNTAAATVHQFAALLLDRVATESVAVTTTKDSPVVPAQAALQELSVAMRCAFLVFRDLCLLANSEPALWLPGTIPVSVPFALEVIQRALQSHTSLFTTIPSFRYLLRERACVLVLKYLQQPQREWAVALRLVHLASTLLSTYPTELHTECEILLSILVRTALSDVGPVWQRALALEACRVVAADPQGLRALFTAYYTTANSSNVFVSFVTSMCGLLKTPTVHFIQHSECIEAQFLRHYRSMASARACTFNVALYSENEGTNLTNDYAAALVVESQVYIARAVGAIGEALRRGCRVDNDDHETIHGRFTGISRVSHGLVTVTSLDPQVSEQESTRAPTRLVQVCWKPLLGALSLLMAHFCSEEAIQIVLKCYQAVTQASAACELHVARDAFLSSLCQYALPPCVGGELRDAAGTISFAPVDAAYEPLPNTRLSAKNVQALKAVFNIAHCMGGLLGASWNLIFDALEQLDRIIASSKTTAAGSEQAVERAIAIGGPDATSSELAILSAALNNLFAGSTRLDDVALGHFLTALSSQSFASLAHEATSRERLAIPGTVAAHPTRLFALNKFVETALINLDRAPTFWPLATQFLLPVANHQTQRIRILGVESLAKVVISAMRLYLSDKEADPIPAAACTSAARAARLHKTPATRWSTPKEANGSWDRVLLAPLEELQRRCAYRETQERILGSTHEVLQACGAGLSEGWLVLLSILYRAATRPSFNLLLPLAFRSVELIASDFLACLPAACLRAYVEVAAAYAMQTEHLNVSLTAIGLQWSICDFLFKTSLPCDDLDIEVTCDDPGAESRSRPSSVQNSDSSPLSGTASEDSCVSALATAPRYADLDLSECVHTHDVWCAVMHSVHQLCVDRRPEVRTCSLHSFVSIVSSHGHQLHRRSWDHFLSQTLHPLLNEIVVKAQSASADELVAKKLGTEGGRDVMMMLHHSRDTEAKQWDETWVLALDAATRLYRGFLPQLLNCHSFRRAWPMLLAFLQSSLLSLPRSSEVAIASISAAHSLMLSSARASIQGKRGGLSSHQPNTKSPQGVAAISTLPPARGHSSARPIIPIAAPLSGPDRDGHARKANGSSALHSSGSAMERERLPSELWTSVWSMLEGAIDLAMVDGVTFATHEKMLCSLLHRTVSLYESCRTHFEEADVLRLLQLAERLARPPEQPLGWEPTQAPTPPSSLQLAVLSLLAKLPPFHGPSVREEEMWPLLLWLLLKLLEPPSASGVAEAANVVDREVPMNAIQARRCLADSSGTILPKDSFAQKCYELLHRLLVEEAGPAAKLAVVEDVLNVLRRVMSWRLHPKCACPALPRAAASGFVEVVDALLPHLPSPEEGAAQRAHSELIDALWTRFSPPGAVLVSPDTKQGTDTRQQSLQVAPTPMGDLLIPESDSFTVPLHESASMWGDAEDGTTLLPHTLVLAKMVGDDLDIQESTLRAARHVLLTTSMQPALRRRLLLMPLAVLSLPAHASVEKDACWREAACMLCTLSLRGGEIIGDHAATFISMAPSDMAQRCSEAGIGSSCASLAAPMLVHTTWQVLSSWAEASSTTSYGAPPDLSLSVSTARAAQIAYLLSLLCTLQLPDGVLAAPDTTRAADPIPGSCAHTAAVAAPVTTPAPPRLPLMSAVPHHSASRAHLLCLAPAMVQCIGEPAALFMRREGVPAEVLELHLAIRRALQLASP